MKALARNAVGVSLKPQHYREVIAGRPAVEFFEVHSENYFSDGGVALDWLTRIRADYPISLHGVGLSLGSADRLDRGHLAKLKRLVDRIEPALVSEHLSWGAIDGLHANELLPLPATREAADLLVARIGEVQDALGRQILVENVSSYLAFEASEMPEWAFVTDVVRRAGCKLLLDVNNIHVGAHNLGFNARRYLEAIDPASVGEIHLAGFDDRGAVLLDTHGDYVDAAVWALYRDALARLGARPTLLEWDTDVPALDVLLGEAARARESMNDVERAAA